MRPDLPTTHACAVCGDGTAMVKVTMRGFVDRTWTVSGGDSPLGYPKGAGPEWPPVGESLSVEAFAAGSTNLSGLYDFRADVCSPRCARDVVANMMRLAEPCERRWPGAKA